jgi:RNA polymerase sigma factor (sigma-70 family)
MEQSSDEGHVSTFDEQLREARQGSREALGALLEHFHEFLTQKSRGLMGNGERSKISDSDIVEEAYQEAVRDFASFRGSTEAELGSWLTRILRNNAAKVHEHFRAWKREISREVHLDAAATGAGEIEDHSPSPLGQALIHEDCLLVGWLMEQLREEYQLVLHLWSRERLTMEAIGARLGCSAVAARRLLRHALSAIGKLMHTSEDGHILDYRRPKA